MKSKVSKKLSDLNFAKGQMLSIDDGAKIKGGARYWCCARNKWINTAG